MSLELSLSYAELKKRAIKILRAKVGGTIGHLCLLTGLKLKKNKLSPVFTTGDSSTVWSKAL